MAKLVLKKFCRSSITGRVFAPGTTGKIVGVKDGCWLVDFGLSSSVVRVPVESRAIEVLNGQEKEKPR